MDEKEVRRVVKDYSDMVHQMLNGGATDGGRMKGKLDIKKMEITVAVCIMVFGVTAAVSGIATGIVSWNRIDTRTSNFWG